MNRRRLWLAYHRDATALIGAIGIVALMVGAIIGGVVWFTFPIGPVSPVQGQVVHVGFQETYLGSVPTASVEVESRRVGIRLPARLGCQSGDQIALERRTTRFGVAYEVGPNTRPCGLVPFRH